MSGTKILGHAGNKTGSLTYLGFYNSSLVIIWPWLEEAATEVAWSGSTAATGLVDAVNRVEMTAVQLINDWMSLKMQIGEAFRAAVS